MRRFPLWLIAASIAAAQDAGLVEGRLINSANQQGIADARVVLTSLLSRTEYSARTGGSGTYRIENLPRGEYTARFDPGAFMPLPPGHAALRVFTVVPGRDPIRMDVEFTPLGRLTGRVLDTDGRPLAGARVQVFHANNRSGHVPSLGKNDQFEIRSVLPG